MRIDRKRRLHTLYWRVVNPLFTPLAGRSRWWVVLETTGRRSGVARRTPLAAGPIDHDSLWLIAVHGERSDFVRNIRASPKVRVRHRGRWQSGTATVHDVDQARLRSFNRYARLGPTAFGIEPRLVQISRWNGSHPGNS